MPEKKVIPKGTFYQCPACKSYIMFPVEIDTFPARIVCECSQEIVIHNHNSVPKIDPGIASNLRRLGGYIMPFVSVESEGQESASVLEPGGELPENFSTSNQQESQEAVY